MDIPAGVEVGVDAAPADRRGDMALERQHERAIVGRRDKAGPGEGRGDLDGVETEGGLRSGQEDDPVRKTLEKTPGPFGVVAKTQERFLEPKKMQEIIERRRDFSVQGDVRPGGGPAAAEDVVLMIGADAELETLGAG